MINLKKIHAIDIAGIDLRDYPDFVDAYAVHARITENGTERELTTKELDTLNEEHSEYIQTLARWRAQEAK